MSEMSIIVLARVIHIVAGVIWAGSTFVMAAVILPMMARHGADGFARWAGPIAQRVGPLSGVAALLTVLSGIYLFAALHARDASNGGLVLKVGAVAAVISLLTGLLISQPAGRQLAALSQGGETAAKPDLAERMTALRRRAALSGRFAALLLGVSVLSMAVFRYVGTL